MKREEQIKQAEIKYSNDTLFDGCDYIGQVAKQEAFIAAAKWADEHPKNGVVNKQELIEKAKEWLKNTLYIHTEIEEDRDFCEIYHIDWVTSDYDSIEDFINSFCKAMEE